MIKELGFKFWDLKKLMFQLLSLEKYIKKTLEAFKNPFITTKLPIISTFLGIIKRKNHFN
jgi:hypothetical protein